MKKLLVSISLLIYFTISTGFVVSVHYCMDRLNGIELGHADEKACGKCGMMITDSDGCCKDEVKVVKWGIDQVVAKVIAPDFSLSIPAPLITDFLQNPLVVVLPYKAQLPHGPPLSKQDSYLQNCVFRI